MEKIENPKNGIDIFKNYWRGHGKLSVAYWGYGVLVTFILYIFGFLIGLSLIPFANEEGKTLFETTLFSRYLAGLYTFLLLYQAIVWVLIWRNSKNSNIFWETIAKLAVLIGIAAFIYQLAIEI